MSLDLTKSITQSCHCICRLPMLASCHRSRPNVLEDSWRLSFRESAANWLLFWTPLERPRWAFTALESQLYRPQTSESRLETGVSMSIEWMARIPLGCARGSQHEQHKDGCRTEIKRRVAICQSWPVGEIELLELETITNETYGKTYWLCEPRTCAWRFKFFHLALISLEVSFTLSG